MRSLGFVSMMPEKPKQREHQPVVIDVGRLGHAGRAGGVDVERAVLDGEHRALVRCERCVGELRQVGVEPRQVRGFLAVRPDFDLAIDALARGLEALQQFGRDDDVLRLDHVDAVGERGAGEVGVDQRDHDAGLREPEPDRHVFRPVGHHQADDVAFHQALRACPARVAVGARSERAIAQALMIGDQRGRVAVARGELVDDRRKHARRMFGDRLRAGERTQRAARVNEISLDLLNESHGARNIRRRSRRRKCSRSPFVNSQDEGRR